jgi:hypothetical protein
MKDQRMFKSCSLLSALAAAPILFALPTRAATFTESFSSNPLQHGWKTHGDAGLFQWDWPQCMQKIETRLPMNLKRRNGTEVNKENKGSLAQALLLEVLEHHQEESLPKPFYQSFILRILCFLCLLLFDSAWFIVTMNHKNGGGLLPSPDLLPPLSADYLWPRRERSGLGRSLAPPGAGETPALAGQCIQLQKLCAFFKQQHPQHRTMAVLLVFAVASH